MNKGKFCFLTIFLGLAVFAFSSRANAVTFPDGKTCHTFLRNLRYYAPSSEVKFLQTALADHFIGKEAGVSKDKSGVFEPFTASSVVGIQQHAVNKRNILLPDGLKYGTGFFGPYTRGELNSLYGCLQNPTKLTVIPGPQNPGNKTVNYGARGVKILEFKLTNIEGGEDISISQISVEFHNVSESSGSSFLKPDILKNFSLYLDNARKSFVTDLSSKEQKDGDADSDYEYLGRSGKFSYVWFIKNLNLTIPKGESRIISVRVDVSEFSPAIADVKSIRAWMPLPLWHVKSRAMPSYRVPYVWANTVEGENMGAQTIINLQKSVTFSPNPEISSGNSVDLSLIESQLASLREAISLLMGKIK